MYIVHTEWVRVEVEKINTQHCFAWFIVLAGQEQNSLQSETAYDIDENCDINIAKFLYDVDVGRSKEEFTCIIRHALQLAKLPYPPSAHC